MSYTMLLADDSVTTHRIMELTFAGEDIGVVSVTDGEQAVDRLRTTRPDILVAEVALPRMDGYKLSEHVKGTPGLAGLPVLLLTGAFAVVDESRVRSSGAAGIIVKPFEPEVVIKRVKELLGIPEREPQIVGGRLVTSAEPPSPESVAHRGVTSAASANQRASAVAAVEDEPTTVPSTLSFVEEFAQETSVPPRSEKAESASSGSADDRDQIDEAFRTLDQPRSSGAANRPQAHQTPPSGVATGSAPGPSSDSPVFEIDQEWFDGNLAARASAPTPAPSPIVPDVAETFQALLAAEQGEASRPSVSEPLVLSDDVIERIAARVAERLSEGVLVETVRSVVENVAERLVREEIARIRAKAEVHKK